MRTEPRAPRRSGERRGGLEFRRVLFRSVPAHQDLAVRLDRQRIDDSVRVGVETVARGGCGLSLERHAGCSQQRKTGKSDGAHAGSWGRREWHEGQCCLQRKRINAMPGNGRFPRDEFSRPRAAKGSQKEARDPPIFSFLPDLQKTPAGISLPTPNETDAPAPPSPFNRTC